MRFAAARGIRRSFGIAIVAVSSLGSARLCAMGDAWRLAVRSYEHGDVDGEFRIDFAIRAYEDVAFGLEPVVRFDPRERCLLDYRVASTRPVPAIIPAGRSYRGAIVVSFDPGQRPYSYTKLRLGFRAPGATSIDVWEHVYVYFTPWDTVEVWSAEAFEDLDRVWSSPSDRGAPRRRRVERSAVPVADLSAAERDDSRVPRGFHSVDGLAFAVPRRIADGTPRPEPFGRKPLVVGEKAPDGVVRFGLGAGRLGGAVFIGPRPDVI